MTPRPDVLIIQADQFRSDCLGAAGNPDVRTPNLDRLAADGVRYTEAFCPLPVCTPSRYSLLSGLHVHQHGGWTNRSTLAPGVDTFPRALRRAGYRTTAIGKMHLTPTYLDVGYDRMELAEQDGPGRYDDDYHRDLWAAGRAPVVDLVDQEQEFRAQAPPSYWETYGSGTSDLPEEHHSTTWIGERALRALDDWSDEGGNLLHVSFIKPHHPFDPPSPWDEAYDPGALGLPPGWTDEIPPGDRPYREGYFGYERLTEPVLRRVVAHYYATISQLDAQVGRLLDRLRERGRYDDTLIVFTSDHGEYLGFHHLLLKHGPMYDPLVKVPLLVKFPVGSPAFRRGATDDSLVSLVDLAPTVLSVCGVRPARPLPGLDLSDPNAGRDVVIVEDFDPIRYMARTRTHKLLLDERPEREALFDLAEDPYELDNRIHDPAYAPVVGRLRETVADWLMYRTPTPNHLDRSAPVISADNVPTDDARRASLHAFFREQVAEYPKE